MNGQKVEHFGLKLTKKLKYFACKFENNACKFGENDQKIFGPYSKRGLEQQVQLKLCLGSNLVFLRKISSSTFKLSLGPTWEL